LRKATIVSFKKGRPPATHKLDTKDNIAMIKRRGMGMLGFKENKMLNNGG